MVIYLSILFICICLFCYTNSKQCQTYSINNITNVFLVLLCFFLCFGYTTGTDWRTYEHMYGWVRENASSMFLFTEPGYVMYTYVFSALGIDFFHFLIFTKIVLYIIVFKTLKYYCPQGVIFISVLFFIAWYAFFLFIDNPLRNLIAICIFLCSLRYLREKCFKPYFLLTIIAMSFHFSAIVMLLLYFCGNRNFQTRNLIIAYIVFNLLLLNGTFIFNVLSYLFSSIPIIGDKVESYATDNLDGRGKLFSLGYIIHTIMFILLIAGRQKIESQKYGKMIFIFAALLPIFFRLGLTITVMGRFQLYIAIFYVIAIGILYRKFEKRSKVIYVLGILLVCVASCFSYMTKDSRYIPYTHYFFMNHNMTFTERDSYNPENSPYKSND